MTNPEEDQELLRSKLNLETAKIPWSALQRQFASGQVFWLSDGLDLIEVAYQMAIDNQDQIKKWRTKGSFARVSDDQARQWVEQDSVMWAVVIKPWVLVQALTNKTV